MCVCGGGGWGCKHLEPGNLEVRFNSMFVISDIGYSIYLNISILTPYPIRRLILHTYYAQILIICRVVRIGDTHTCTGGLNLTKAETFSILIMYLSVLSYLILYSAGCAYCNHHRRPSVCPVKHLRFSS